MQTEASTVCPLSVSRQVRPLVVWKLIDAVNAGAVVGFTVGYGLLAYVLVRIAVVDAHVVGVPECSTIITGAS